MKRENIDEARELIATLDKISWLRDCLPEDDSGGCDVIKIQVGDDWDPTEIENEDFNKHFSHFIDTYKEHLYKELEKID